MGRSTLNPCEKMCRTHVSNELSALLTEISRPLTIPSLNFKKCCILQSPGTHLKVYHHSKDKDCGDEVHEVGQVLSVEGLSQSTHFVCPSGQQMEKRNDCSLKLCA